MSNEIIRNVEAEQSVLGSIILEGDLIKDCRLKPNQFAVPVHQVVFKTMRELDDEDKPIDLVSLVAKFDKGFLEQVGGMEFFASLADTVSTTSNFSYHEGLIIESWKMRHAQEVAGDLYNRIQQEKDIQAISDTISKLNTIEEIGYSDEFDLKETLVDLYGEMQQDLGDLTGIDTGFNELNYMTSGFQGGDFIIVGARPSVGKTAFALNIAQNAASTGVATAIFSLEMGKTIIKTNDL